MENETIAVEALSTQVGNFRTKARDIIRMTHINAKLTDILSLENQLKEYKDSLTKQEKYLAIEKYDLSKLDTEHPDYENKKKSLESIIKNSEKDLEESKFFTDMKVKSLEERIANAKESITKWETGENKVSKELLEEITNDLILKA